MSAPNELVVGRYRRQKLVGSGGMGTVWEAWDELLDRRVALKELHTQPGLTHAEAELANDRAMREARITARLSHRYAVPVFDVAEHEGRPCIVMPFIPSVTLSAVLREGGPLNPGEAAGVGAQVAAALAAAHGVGIVHRDVKPGNILIADDGAALISDFGISHALGDVTLTSTGEVHGTPAYLAPEVARGAEATPASDVFSLASTLFAALEGAPPFGTDVNAIALLHRVAAGAAPTPQRAGPLTPLLTAMLSADPADRPPMGTVASMLRSLSPAAPAPPPIAAAESPAAPAATPPPIAAAESRAVASIPSSTAEPDVTSSSTPDRRRRRPARLLAAVVALVMAGILAGVLWIQYSDTGARVAQGDRSPATDGSPADSRPPVGTSSSPASSTTPETPAPGASGSGSPPPSASTRPSSTQPSSPSVTPSVPRTTPRPKTTASSSPPTPRRRAPGSPASADELVGAVRAYYGALPDGTDEAWSRLTVRYQTKGEATSREYFERFWGDFNRVTLSDVSGQPPNRALATITYYYKNGKVEKDRAAFWLAIEDGQLKIDDRDLLRSWRVSGG